MSGKKIRNKNLHFKTWDEWDTFCEGKDIQSCNVTVDEKITDEEYCKRYKGLMINTTTGKVIDFLSSTPKKGGV